MKTAIIYIKDYKGIKKGYIESIMESDLASTWNHSIISNGFAKKVSLSQDIENVSKNNLEAILVPEVAFVAEVPESWSDGSTTVYDVNDIPTLTDANGDPYLDTNFVHISAIPEVPFVAEHWAIQKTASADQNIRQGKINELSNLRASLLQEADIEINKLEDNGGDSSAWRTYRQELRDITETYKKLNGDWKATVDSLIISEFIFPTKP